MKIKYLFFILFTFILFFIASCAKNQSTNEDLNFKKMCQDAGYEWMKMKPMQNGKFVKNASECWGCMLQGMEHVCDKEKFIEITGKNSDYQPSVDLKTIPEKIKITGVTALTLDFRDPEGKPLNLEVEHEKLVHVIIINDDFSIFSHIHPEDSSFTTTEMKNKGIFSINYTFSKSGKYLIGMNFAANNKDYSKHFYVNVAGSQVKQIKKNLSLSKIFDGYAVNLSFTSKIISRREATLIYYFEKDSKPLMDMEPYLGATMHIAIVKEDLTNFMHTHAMLPDEMPMNYMNNHSTMDSTMEMVRMVVPSHFGPELMIEVVFPDKGLYQIFGEFKHNGKVIVTSFMVEVE